MKFNEKRAKEAGIDTGAAVAGAVGILALTNKATALMTEKSPNSAITPHIPAIVLACIIGAQAFDLVPDNPLVDSALQGCSVVTGMQVVREYSGANTAQGRTATSGLQALINQYVPGFDQGGVTSASAVVQAALPASTTAALNGLRGMGSLTPYRDPAEALRLSGEFQRSRPLQTLGAAPATAGGLKDIG